MFKILLVDDDELFSLGLASLLKKMGYDVDLATNGQQALEKISQQQQPDLIICDIMMPVMNGFQFLQIVKKQMIDVPVLMLSGRNNKSDLTLAKSLGVDEILTKPIGFKKLVSKIQQRIADHE